MATHFTIVYALLSDSRVAAIIVSALGVDLAHLPVSANGVAVALRTIRGVPVLAVEVADETQAKAIHAALEAARVPFLMRTQRELFASTGGERAAVRCDIDGKPVAGIVMFGGRPMADIEDVAALARYTQLSEAVIHARVLP
jgi:hypothetical protein